MKNALKKRTLLLEQLENRELLSATTWDNAAQADAAVAAEMAATLNENAPIDLTAAFSAAELETTAAVGTTWVVTSDDDSSDPVPGMLRYAVLNAADGDTIKFAEGVTSITLKSALSITKDLTIDGGVDEDNKPLTTIQGSWDFILKINSDVKFNATGVLWKGQQVLEISKGEANFKSCVFESEHVSFVLNGGTVNSLGNYYYAMSTTTFQLSKHCSGELNLTNDIIEGRNNQIFQNIGEFEVTITNCTIDSLGERGAAILGGNGDSSFTIRNSLIRGEMNGKDANFTVDSVFYCGSWNAGSTKDFTNFIKVSSDEFDALFAENGAVSDDQNGSDYYQIEDGSAATDQGNDSYVENVPTDHRGSDRILGSSVDVGAFESGSSPKVLAPTITAVASGTTISLAISEVDGAVGYAYEWSTNADFTVATSVDASAGTFAVEGWNADTTYYFRAVAKGGESSDNSPYSPVVSTATVPNAPENVRFENFSYGDYTFASASEDVVWNDAANVEEYFLVQVSTDNVEWSNVGRAAANATVLKATQLRQATTYYVRVCAGNAAGQSAWSYGEFTTPLAAPGEIKYGYYDGTKQTLEMYWKDNSDAEEKFVLEYKKDGSNWKPAGVTGADEAQRVGWLVWENSEYQYRARAEKGDIVSDWSPVTTITPATSDVAEPLFSAGTIPAAPTGLTTLGAYDAETGRLALSWTDNSLNEDYFVVEYSVDGGSEWLEAARSGKNESVEILSKTNLGVDCLYRVYAANAAGNSSYSNVLTVPATVFKPAAPTNLTLGAYNEESRTLEMSWTDNSSDEDYFVVEYTKNGSDWKVAGRVGADVVSRVGWGVSANADWSYRVYAVNAAGRSEYSNVVSFAPMQSQPAAPTNLTLGVYNEETRRLEMSWTDNSFNEKYFVVEYSKNGSDWKVAGNVAANVVSRVGWGVSANTDWSYRVYAVNDAGRSDYSNVVSFNSAKQAVEEETADVLSQAFIDFFAEDDSEDDFWFELEETLGKRLK